MSAVSSRYSKKSVRGGRGCWCPELQVHSHNGGLPRTTLVNSTIRSTTWWLARQTDMRSVLDYWRICSDPISTLPMGGSKARHELSGRADGNFLGAPTTLPGNSPALVSDPPGGRVKSLRCIHLLSLALTRRIPDPGRRSRLRGVVVHCRSSRAALCRVSIGCTI